MSGADGHGWVILDKPAGISSAAAVAAVRRLLGGAKAGHAGTLDPIATGVLPIAVGEATKTVAYAVGGRKAYRFQARFGEARVGDDLSGAVTATAALLPDGAAIRAALPAFQGRIRQRPPVVSAIKVGGRRAYARARAGETFALAEREVEVVSLVLVAQPAPDCAEFDLECGPGTYVRSLVRDLAARLGTVGHVSVLRRTRVGPFVEAQAITLSSLQALVHSGGPSAALCALETVLADIPALALNSADAERMRRGQSIAAPEEAAGTVLATALGRPVALARIEGGRARPVRVFNL
ncbi:MAG: tRNA pseudouridine(55) synthase TruB [Alphaproteobacteria bacterium]|nr:tRNA pseudouridine(55) synthase TruB [Alphaproteobacteria bacterium]